MCHRRAKSIMFTIYYVTVTGVLWITSLMKGGNCQLSRSEDFVSKHLGFLGDYFAGHGQFPWVVEIRTLDSENWKKQEEWAVGNLIGPRYVLSTCNAVATFHLLPPVRDRYVVWPKVPEKYKVMYSPDYPYHGQNWYTNRYIPWRSFNTELKTGTRDITRMSPHPFCNPTTLKYFWGIAELGKEPIRPFRNFINYAYPELDATQLFRKWYLLRHKSTWSPALLSTWGRDTSGSYSVRTMLFNFKLRYKVSFQKWSECQKVSSMLGWSTWNSGLEWVNQTFCMSVFDPEHTMGTICDHDRGAPIVWDDAFVGIVVTGVKLEHCNILNPQPFVVQSIEDALVYWTNVERHILSYYISNDTHLFPGIAGQVIAPVDASPETASDAPRLAAAGVVALLVPASLLIPLAHNPS